MAQLKENLKSDMVAAMKAKDSTKLATLRMVLTAVTNEEVAGDAARELSDEEVQRVLTREAKKRREAAEAFETA
ncbi:GatB/YqeY domain-containing protein, partial [Kibdelosporangium lantanae]